MNLLKRLRGEQPKGGSRESSATSYAGAVRPGSEEPVDVALSMDMQIYTADELTRALSSNIGDRAQRLVERATQDMAGLPKDFYVPITFPNGEVAYAALSTLAGMEDALKQTGVKTGGNSLLKAKSGMHSVDAIDALIEKYSAELESVLPISGMNPLNEVSTRVRAAVVDYFKEQIMPVLQRPQISGHEILGKKQLEQRLAGMQPYNPVA